MTSRKQNVRVELCVSNRKKWRDWLKENHAIYLYILGVTQDAGYPQTGCYEEHCMPGWEDPGRNGKQVWQNW